MNGIFLTIENNSTKNNNNCNIITSNITLVRIIIMYLVQRGSSSSHWSHFVCRFLYLYEKLGSQIYNRNKNIRQDMRKENIMSCWVLSVMSDIRATPVTSD